MNDRPHHAVVVRDRVIYTTDDIREAETVAEKYQKATGLAATIEPLEEHLQ